MVILDTIVMIVIVTTGETYRSNLATLALNIDAAVSQTEVELVVTVAAAVAVAKTAVRKQRHRKSQ